MADPSVDIVLPTGEAATVPQQDLARALAAGAKVPGAGPQYAPGSDEEFLNSGLGQAITGVLGAGRAVTGGLTDIAMAEGANILGGEGARKDVLRAFSRAKEANPYADLAGEVGGLFLGGGGITQAGEAAEAGIASRAGEGLVGRLLSGGVRGAVEGGMLGAEHSLTEDTLGDHAINGEKMFQMMGKEALLGGGTGAAISGLGYGLGRALGLGTEAATEAGVEAGGKATKSALDDVAGLKGAGGDVRKGMEAAEDTIQQLQKTGLTSEQAAEMVDTAKRATNIPGLVDEARDFYLRLAGGDPERAAIIKRGYEIQAGLRDSHENVLRTTAAKLSNKATSMFRDLEVPMNEVQFAGKPEMMRKLIDPSFKEAARDASARMFQEAEEAISGLKALPDQGMMSAQVSKIGKSLETLKRVFADEGADAADHMIALNKLKQVVGDNANFATKNSDIRSGNRVLTDLFESLRRGLEDESAFGLGGRAQKALNESYSELVPRRNHFAQTVGQTIDRGEGGVRLAGGDFQKMQGLLHSLTGDATDAEIEGVKSVEAMIDGMRKRVADVEKYGDLSAEQAAKVARGKQALEEFAQEFSTAKNDIAANNRLRSMQLTEREGRSVGGLVGLIGDVVTKPLTTMERLAQIRSATVRLDKTIDTGIKKALEFRSSAAKVSSEARAVAEKEIGQIRELGGNPTAMAERVRQMTASLSRVAPKIAEEVGATAMRALTFLAKEAPIPLGTRAVMGMPTKEARFSDQQIAAWQAKRTAALGSIDGKTAPEAIIGDLQKGRLNRDAIRTIEFVSPKLFQQLQQTTQKQLSQMAADGKLDRLTLAQQGAIASLLKVPPGKMWEPDFMLMMQAAKSYPEFAENNRAGGAPTQGTSKRAIKLDADVFQTETQAIEAR